MNNSITGPESSINYIHGRTIQQKKAAGSDFTGILDKISQNSPGRIHSHADIQHTDSTDNSELFQTINAANSRAYNKPVVTGAKKMSAIRKYKDDQLLSNPGGDHYYLNDKNACVDSSDQSSFFKRVGKDISDSFLNLKNFFSNLLFGAKSHYRDENDQIAEKKEKGLLGSAVSFLKNMGSALSFGLYRPGGEEKPQGFTGKCKFVFSRLKKAIFGDLIQGVSECSLKMGEDLMFSGLNLFEALPDATVGNIKSGRELTTAVFDNTQVILDYITDIMPSGEAWSRAHSADIIKGELPFINNIKKPEQDPGDPKLKYVRNTGFRKGIETAGTIITDILSLNFLCSSVFSVDDGHHKK